MQIEFLRAIENGEAVAVLLIDKTTGRASRVELSVSEGGKFGIKYPDSNPLELETFVTK
jgi:hypothetical protein